MKNLLAGAFVALITLCLSGIAMADSIAEVWTCEVKEGKSIEDVQATNSKWLKWINAHVEGGGIKSSVGTTVVGNNEIFIFVDTYPNLATWPPGRLQKMRWTAMREMNSTTCSTTSRNAAKIVCGRLRTPSNKNKISICSPGGDERAFVRAVAPIA